MARKKIRHDNGSMSPLLALPARGVIPSRIFRSMYPLCHALGLKPVSVAGNEYDGFDIDEVERKLGAPQFASLMAELTHVFCCGHRNWPADHPDPFRRNCEAHCVYALDLENFLKARGRRGRGVKDGGF